MLDPSADITAVSVPASPTPLLDPAVDRAVIDADAANAAAVAEATVRVNLQFPEIGFIDPEKELEMIRQAVEAMPTDVRFKYPDTIRAKLLAWHANHDNPPVTDEELACAIFIKRITDTPLVVEDLAVKATGKAPVKSRAKAKPKQESLDDLLGL